MIKSKVTGKLTNYLGEPLAKGQVRFYNENFEALYTATTSADGTFEIEVEKRIYPSVFICQSYKDKYLEYWHWNFNPDDNEHLDIKIDGLELYGLHAWRTEPTYPGLKMFFRPMSLKKFKLLGEPEHDGPLLIAPDLSKADISVMLDGKKAEVVGLSKVREHVTENQYLDAYFLNVSTANFDEIRRVHLNIHSSETGERGMAGLDLLN